jgi:hypothetical protein
VAQDGASREDLTLEQVRAGMESTWSTVRNRKIRVVQTPWNVTEETASPTHPDRVEFEFIRTSDGKYFDKTDAYRSDKLFRSSVNAYDGKFCTAITHNPPTSAPQATYNYTQIKSHGEWEQFSLEYLGMPFHEMLGHPNARLVGEVEVNGVPCIRVEGVIPAGFNGNHPPIHVFMDIDPEKGFWARRLLSRFEDDPEGTLIQQPGGTVMEFEKHGEIWYPQVVQVLFAGKELAYCYILEAEFNGTYPPTTFQPAGPMPVVASVDGPSNSPAPKKPRLFPILAVAGLLAILAGLLVVRRVILSRL